MWTFRRNERDVVNLYNSLSDLMSLATGKDMLNFGYWDDKNNHPVLAQTNLCKIFGKLANLKPGQNILDVGSGNSSPARLWHEEFGPLDLTEVNINQGQLKNAKQNAVKENFSFVNATATCLPFAHQSVDRVLALESAQHFKPIEKFFSDSHNILAKDGLLALAIPVMGTTHAPLVKLGLLSMTWSSEHYSIDFLQSALKEQGFCINEFQKIGTNVYCPLADYYFENRVQLRPKILEKYPSYVEKILFKSLGKMKTLSQNKTIEYLLVSCTKAT